MTTAWPAAAGEPFVERPTGYADLVGNVFTENPAGAW